MARAHLNKAIIRKVSGTPADGSVQVYEAGTTTPLAQTMYVGDTGATARANPFTFTGGVVDFYLDNPQRVKLVITPTGGAAQTFDNVDVADVAENYYSATNVPPYPVTLVAGRAGAVSLTAADIGSGTFPGGMTTPTTFMAGDSANGTVSMHFGDNTHTGYMEFTRAGGNRQGYIGFSTTAAATDSGTIPYVAGVHDFSGTIWESGQRVYSPNNKPQAADIGAGTFPSTGTYSFQGAVTMTGASAGLELGANSSNTPFIDFHSGSSPVDYDARILASGGNGVSGNGTLTLYAATVGTTGTLLENGNRVYSAANPPPAGHVIASVTGTYSVAAGVTLVLANGTFTVTVPSAASSTNREINVKNTGTGVITVATSGGNIDGSATAVIAKQYSSVTLVSDGTNWNII